MTEARKSIANKNEEVAIYFLVDSITRVPYYVGQTIHPKTRRSQHGVNPQDFVIIDYVHSSVANEHEQKWINALANSGIALNNIEHNDCLCFPGGKILCSIQYEPYAITCRIKTHNKKCTREKNAFFIAYTKKPSAEDFAKSCYMAASEIGSALTRRGLSEKAKDVYLFVGNLLERDTL